MPREKREEIQKMPQGAELKAEEAAKKNKMVQEVEFETKER